MSKSPSFDPQECNYKLDFRGMAGIPSIKNFIIENEEHPESLIFGRQQDKESYLLRIKAPFSIIQAVAIAMSSIHHKFLWLMICISEYIYVSYRQSHEIVVFFDNLRSFLNFLLSSFAFDFIFDLLGVDQSRTSEDIIFRDVLLTLCLALLIFSFALFLQSLLFFLVLEGLLFFVLLFFFHDF